MKNVLLLILSAISVAASCTFWKISSDQVIKTHGPDKLLFNQCTNIWFILGWIAYFIATILWIYILGKYEYSKIYPIYIGICIVLSLIIGFVFFKENTGMLYKATGATFIILGSILVARS